MRRFGEGLFPVRFLGFGLFWAWLFMVGLSPSPLFGAPTCLGGLPFELFEVLTRCAVIVVSLVLSRFIATDRGKYVYLAVGVVAGLAVTPLLLWGGGEAAHSLGAFLAAVAEVSLFLMWLSFFGATRLGDTLTLLVLSYGIGALVFLATLMGGEKALIAASLVFPVFSAVALVLSGRLVAHRDGMELFTKSDGDDDESERENDAPPSRPLLQDKSALKMTLALGLYSMAFSLVLSMAFAFAPSLSAGYLVEPIGIAILAGFYILYLLFAKDAAKPYVLYRVVAPAMGVGFALIAAAFVPVAGEGLVIVGYLMFEVLALNDYCNLVKVNDSSLFSTMALGRLAISIGMLGGWLIGFFCAGASLTTLAVLGLLLVLLTSTLVFTDRDRMPLVSLADDLAIDEGKDSRPDKDTALAAFAAQQKLSKRETEVFGYLIAGRTTSYIAEHLFVAESTVRAHVYNIYQKADVHSRMELMDAFDAFWTEGMPENQDPTPLPR